MRMLPAVIDHKIVIHEFAANLPLGCIANGIRRVLTCPGS